MTTEEKFEGIKSRIKYSNIDFDAEMISALVVIKYMNDFATMGIGISPTEITPSGLQMLVIADEFDWKPLDKDIIEIVNELVTPKDVSKMIELLIKYRDNQEEFIKLYKKV